MLKSVFRGVRQVFSFVGIQLTGALVLVSVALAEGASVPAVPAGAVTGGGVAGAPQQPGLMGMLVPFLLMFAVLYFLMIRPQQKKMREQQDMLKALEHGTEVVTSSGILGKITGITDKVVTLEIADNVRIKILKSQIAQVVKGQIKDLAT